MQGDKDDEQNQVFECVRAEMYQRRSHVPDLFGHLKELQYRYLAALSVLRVLRPAPLGALAQCLRVLDLNPPEQIVDPLDSGDGCHPVGLPQSEQTSLLHRPLGWNGIEVQQL